MQYDPIKRTLGNFFGKSVFLRKLFYRLLHILLLRSWHVRRELREWARQNTGPRDILDAGMGFGQYSYMLATMHDAWNVKGVDVKYEQIEDCNRFFREAGITNARFEYGDLTQLGENSQYDLILSIDVMEHILEDDLVFQNLFQALKPEGMLLISTPSDKGGSDVHDHDEGSFIEEHVRDGYNIDAIQQQLRQAGFRVTDARYQYGKPGSLAWKLSMKYPILMLGQSKLFFILLPFYYLFVMPVVLLLNYLDVSNNHPEGTGLIVKAWK